VAELPVVNACTLSQARSGRADRNLHSFATYALCFGVRLWELVTIGWRELYDVCARLSHTRVSSFTSKLQCMSR
ncbi:MAG TPA: hypothetical protein VMJ11_09215, partial [Paraburkholderia sp.]|uniref:hypothetical protein n=1 Tax=Paraburkholderia sp. TaxID=1926495 RepID=UPI002BA8580B